MILVGDCREVMPLFGPFDLIIADPPYGDTSLDWDRKVRGWEAVAQACLKPSGSMWVFGSMRYFLAEGVPAGWCYAQDVVWEKHNGTGFAKDRLRRVHEHAVQFYRADTPWSGVYKHLPRVPRTGADKSVHRRTSLPHTGKIGASVYVDDGTRGQRSVIRAPSVRGGAHKTAKPVGLLEVLVQTSCPPGGLIGDFFAGSGSVGLAAAGRRYVGCELDPATAAKARDRLNAAALSP